MNNIKKENTFNTLFVASGKSVNDLGNYEMCQTYKDEQDIHPLKYSLMTVYSMSKSSLMVQMGVCIP
jgi:hypothetical protein